MNAGTPPRWTSSPPATPMARVFTCEIFLRGRSLGVVAEDALAASRWAGWRQRRRASAMASRR
jgi:hypothetical protein